MPALVDEQAILDALHAIPRDRWGVVLRLLDALNPDAPAGDAEGSPPIRTAADLLASGLVGLWADRDDIDDAASFARQLRRDASRRQGPPDAP